MFFLFISNIIGNDDVYHDSWGFTFLNYGWFINTHWPRSLLRTVVFINIVSNFIFIKKISEYLLTNTWNHRHYRHIVIEWWFVNTTVDIWDPRTESDLNILTFQKYFGQNRHQLLDFFIFSTLTYNVTRTTISWNKEQNVSIKSIIKSRKVYYESILE